MRLRHLSGIFVVLLLTSLFVCQPGTLWGLGSKKQDCLKCDVLTEKDAKSVLENLRLNEAKLLTIQPSPIQGLWEVAVENRGDRFLIYIDCSKKFVMPGPIIERQTGIDRTRQRVEELNKERRVDLTGLRFDEALVMGNPNAPVKVIGFLDPD